MLPTVLRWLAWAWVAVLAVALSAFVGLFVYGICTDHRTRVMSGIFAAVIASYGAPVFLAWDYQRRKEGR